MRARPGILLRRGCGRRAPPAVPWEKNHLRVGQALYRENCVVCHDIDRPQSKKFGPSFYQLFQRAQDAASPA